MSPDVRIEYDAFGPTEIPASKYWGAQTERALAVFTVGDERFPSCLIRAFGLQKIAAARANRRLGVLEEGLARAIEAAAEELRQGRFDDHFPLTIWQTGSGTQTNMNANEVIANRANELLGQPLGTKSPIHPNDHVNRSQSSNDSFPTVMHLTAVLKLRDRLVPSLRGLHQELHAKSIEFGDVLKVGRTHLMDAVPMYVGQTFDTFARQIDNAIARVASVGPRLQTLPQGGTAIGTGLNAPVGFDQAFCEEVSTLSGVAFTANESKFEGMSAHDALVELSGVLNTIAVSLLKIANDIRLLGSGPRNGLGELLIPDDGLTSSIMPGKRNPTIAEVVAQAAYQVIGNHTTITMAAAAGHFELNVAKPVIIYNVLQSVRLLADVTRIFASGLVRGIDVDRHRLSQNVENALLVVTALNPVLGYDKVSQITSLCMRDRLTPREATLKLNLLSGTQYDELVVAEAMTGPKNADV